MSTKNKEVAATPEEVKIFRVIKETHNETGGRFLKVEYTLGTSKERHSHAFPIDTDEKVITKTLKKIAQTRANDAVIAEKTRAASKAEAKADKTIEALEGAVIK